MHEAGETGTCTGTIRGPSSVPDTLHMATPGRLMFQIVGVMAEFVREGLVQEAAACPGSLVIGGPKMSDRKSPFAHILDLPREKHTCIARELEGHVGLVAEVSPMLAFHPSNRYV